jgi:hypothetical protein
LPLGRNRNLQLLADFFILGARFSKFFLLGSNFFRSLLLVFLCLCKLVTFFLVFLKDTITERNSMKKKEGQEKNHDALPHR